MTKARAALVAFLILLAIGGLNAYLSLHNAHRLTGDEDVTCRIQSTGLRAQRHLTQVLSAFNVFLQPPPVGAVKKQPPIPGYYAYSVKAVRYHLPLYLALEAKQPPSRRC